METEQRGEPTLSDTPLAAVLTGLAEEGATGVLLLEGGGEAWLSDGRLYLVATASSPDLAQVLYAADIGTAAEVAAALDGEPGTGPTGLDRLLASRPGAAGAVERLLHEFNLNSLFELLVPSDESYRFEAATTHPLGDRFAEDTSVLLEKARDRVDIWRRIAASIPSTAAVFRLARSLPDEIDQRLVTAEEWRFLSLLDGTRTVAEIINETGESAFRVCSSLYRLLLEQLIEEARP